MSRESRAFGDFVFYTGERGDRCLDCGAVHEFYVGQDVICPDLPDAEACTRAIESVDYRLAVALGQPKRVAETMLDDLTDHIVQWANDHPTWGNQVLRRYQTDPRLTDFLVLEDVPEEEDEGEDELPDSVRKLIIEN